MMRVIHLLDHALPVVSGYSVRSHQILRAQADVGIEVVALARSGRVRHVTHSAIDGIPYVWLPEDPEASAMTPLTSIGRILRSARNLDLCLRDRGATALHAHSPSLNGIAASAVARRRALPFVYELRGLWEDAAVERHRFTKHSLRYRAARRIETWVLRQADAVTTISDGLVDEVVGRGVARESVFLVPNGVDVERFSPRAADPELVARNQLGGRLVIGFVGFFHRYEGIDVLVRAFAQLAARVPEAVLLLVGSGEQEDELRQLSATLGVPARVMFAGETAHEQVPRWYSVCDVLVYPRRSGKSTELVTPLKPLEAMAMGKAVVASAVGGIRELVQSSESALLCRPDDPGALAAVLEQAAASLELRQTLGTRAREQVARERSWRALGPIYASLYESLAQSRPRGS